MALSRIRACQRCKVLLPHFQLDRTAKDLKFCSCTFKWHEIPSALLLCQFFVRCEVPLPHFRPALAANDLKVSFWTSALPGLLKVWIPQFRSVFTAKDLKFRFPYFRSARTSKDLVHFPHLFCQDFQIWVSPLPHFISPGTSKGVLPHFCSALTAKDHKFRFPYLHSARTSKDLIHLPGLPSMGRSTSAFHLCRYYQSSASALLLCLNCKRYEVQLPHFRSARTFKSVKLCFRNSSLPLLPKIWSSAFHTSVRPGLRRSRSFSALVLPGLPNMGKSTSTFHLCLDCQRSEVPLSVLPLGQDFERSRSSSALILPGLPKMDKFTSAFHFCRDFQRSEVPLLHFCFALTVKDVELCFLSSAVRSYYAFQHEFVLSVERRVR